jgi:hypothetical protein
MTRSPLFWIAATVGGLYAYHHWVAPIPGGKNSSGS